MLRCYASTPALFAILAASAPAQTTLSVVDPNPCCLAEDGRGNVFAVSPLMTGGLASGISVAKVDASGTVVSIFRLGAGTFDDPLAAAVDPQGNLWIVGSTSHPGASGTATGLMVELDRAGASILFSGTFGGQDPKGGTIVNAITFDVQGNAYIGGSTSQSDFPVTPGGFIGKFGSAPSEFQGPTQYGFVSKLAPNAAGYAIVYTALLGGEQLAIPPCPSGGGCDVTPPLSAVSAVAVDASGAVTAAGTTDAADFPVTPGAFQTDCACNLGARSAFVTRLNPQGSGLVWSTMLGAWSQSSTGIPMTVGGIALDSSGNVFIDGTTPSSNFPVTPGVVQSQFTTPAQGSQGVDGFVAKLDATGSRLLFSTFYGGGDVGRASAPRLDAQGNVWFSEQISFQSDLALHENSLLLGNPQASGVIAELAPDGSAVLFSESLPNGVAGQDLVLDPDGGVTAAGAGGFVLRHPAGGPSGVSILGIADTAENAVTSTIAPGEILSVYGTGLGVDGTQVLLGGNAAPIIYSSANQLNVLAPYELAAGAQVEMQIVTPAGSSQLLPLEVVAAQPNVVTVLNADGSVNVSYNPTRQGSTITIWISGAGALEPTPPNGSVAGSSVPAPVLPVQVDFDFSFFTGIAFGSPTIGTITVTPAYAAASAGTLVNLVRIDVPVPSFPYVPSGCEISVRVGSARSPTFPLALSTAAAN